jgi:hypothetical protein
MGGTPFHPVSEIFPLMTGAAFDELVHDIQINGLRESLWRHEGQIIDGRNRYNACLKAGVSPTYREWDGEGDLTKFVVSLNLHRRHLNESQRAMVASKLASLPPGVRGDRQGKHANSTSTNSLRMTTGQASELLNVGTTTIAEAKRVRASGAPEIIKAVEDGEISTHSAQRIIQLPKDEQPAALAEKKKPKHERVTPPSNGNGGSKKETFTKRHAGRKAPEAVRGAIGTLVGLATGLDSFTAKDAAPTPDEAKQWERDLLAVISAVNRFRRQLKELSDGEATAA